MAGADLAIGNPLGCTALVCASATHEPGVVPVIQALARNGADLNSRCGDRRLSALHIAAAKDFACSVDALIEAGAGVEIQSRDGETPLCLAAKGGLVKALLALLRRGALVSARTNKGQMPLHLACRLQSHVIEVVVKELLRWDADETALDNDGKSHEDLLDNAAQRRGCSQDGIERVRLLLSRAPADRAWRRRGWLVMLRSRVSAGNANAGGEGTEGSEKTGGRQVARSEDAVDVGGGGEGGQVSSGVGGVGSY